MSMVRDGRADPDSPYKFEVVRERLRRHPGPVLDFAIGRQQQLRPAWLESFVREHAELALARRGPEELEACVEAAAERLARVYGVEVGRAAVLAAPNARSAMSALAATLVAPGDPVLVTEPGYPVFSRLAAQCRARVLAAVLDPDRGFAPDLATLDPAAPLRLAALNYPNNPTGAVLSGPALVALRERLGAAVVFNDATYGPLTYEGPPSSLLAGARAGAPLVELHGLGKLFGSGPLGLAFLVGHEDLVARIGRYGEFASTQLSSLQVRLATRCLESWEHVDALRERWRVRLAELLRVVSGLGFDPFPAAGGIYLLCRAPAEVDGRPIANAAEAADLLLARYGLGVVPWEVGRHGYLRFSAAYLPEELDALAGLGRGRRLAAG
jgi:aspartate/methionine/tyrosine aminotransferase